MAENLEQAMLLIKTLDPDANIKFSEFTGKWYLDVGIEIRDYGTLTGVCQHSDSPHQAVFDCLDILKAIDIKTTDKVLVARIGGHRRHFRWNGAAFAESPLMEPSRA